MNRRITIYLPDELIVCTFCVQRRYKMSTISATIKKLLETHPAIDAEIQNLYASDSGNVIPPES